MKPQTEDMQVLDNYQTQKIPPNYLEYNLIQN